MGLVRLGKKTVEVLRRAAKGASVATFALHRLMREFRAAERRGLIVDGRLHRAATGAWLYVLTPKGRGALDAYDAAERAKYPFTGPITDEML